MNIQMIPLNKLVPSPANVRKTGPLLGTEELRELLALEIAGQQLVLDLRDVTLVNQDAVEFLASCEADSITLENCPPYIREWIGRETRRRRQ